MFRRAEQINSFVKRFKDFCAESAYSSVQTAPVIDVSTSVSGLTRLQAQVVNNFQEWLATSAAGVPYEPPRTYSIGDFAVMRTVLDASNVDVSFDVSFCVDGDEFFGRFSNVINGARRLDSEVMSQFFLRYSPELQRRLCDMLWECLLSARTPSMGWWTVAEPFRAVNGLGEYEVLMPGISVKVTEVRQGERGLTMVLQPQNSELGGTSYTVDAVGFWTFVDSFSFARALPSA